MFEQLLPGYEQDLAHLKVKVLAESRSIKAALLEWEREYVLKNKLSAPSLEQMNADKTASSLIRKLKYANALLKEWNINFSN